MVHPSGRLGVWVSADLSVVRHSRPFSAHLGTLLTDKQHGHAASQGQRWLVGRSFVQHVTCDDCEIKWEIKTSRSDGVRVS